MNRPTTRSNKTQARVLTMLRGSRCPLSAYDILAELQKSNSKVAPPTVYRALNALIDRGEVHKVESKKAYIACRCSAHQQPAIMAICNDCGVVEERVAPELVETLTELSEQAGFEPSHHVIEIQGLCGSCGEAKDSV
ncbi:MAG: Fur family transcriptional regulator [Pseudomonadota bacterium]